MYRTYIIRNLFNSPRAFFHKWLKWRSYSSFAFMSFCNLTPFDGRIVNGIVFFRKSEFCEYITSLHIKHSIYVRQFEFFVFTKKQIASIFCNVSFAVQYSFHLGLLCWKKALNCPKYDNLTDPEYYMYQKKMVRKLIPLVWIYTYKYMCIYCYKHMKSPRCDQPFYEATVQAW